MILPHRCDTAMLVGFTGCSLLGGVGLFISLAIPLQDWLLEGSACLFSLGGVGILAYIQLQWQVVLVRKPPYWFKLRMELTEKSQRPRAYWISTTAYVLAALVMLGGVVCAFVAGASDIIQRLSL